MIFRNLKNVKYFSTSLLHKPPWSVLFFGADEFSVCTLKSLHAEFMKGHLLNNLEIVTTIKKQANPVQKYAKSNNLLVYEWPHTAALNKYHIGVVVSFGHLLPENLINSFPFGILNVHGSLLPRWRGASPIVYALANGDTETGVTVMRIKPKHYDIGEIVMQSKVKIEPTMRMPELYTILSETGAACLISTLKQLPEVLDGAKPQSNVGVSFAPKLKPEFAKISWQTMSSTQIVNLDRAVAGVLTPKCCWKNHSVKLVGITDCDYSYFQKYEKECLTPGYVRYDKSSGILRVICANKTSINVEKIGVFGKKLMTASDFYNGFISKVILAERYFA